ncbi:hypothetical protein [Glycomyces rhizosphaerae]|uniref:Uncharacterized protein n=1 Tax=Glycomyces rhizosphaerae TaxID=2054422 RepID=A0ABV7PZW2_9ACTN
MIPAQPLALRGGGDVDDPHINAEEIGRVGIRLGASHHGGGDQVSDTFAKDQVRFAFPMLLQGFDLVDIPGERDTQSPRIPPGTEVPGFLREPN